MGSIPETATIYDTERKQTVMMDYELLNPLRGVSDIILKSSDPTNNFVQLTYGHAAVHRDIIMNANHYTAAGTPDVLFFFNSGVELEVHLEYVVSAGGPVQVFFYESPDVDSVGSPVTTTRLNLKTNKTVESTVTVGGTVVDNDYGTLLKHQFNGGGGGGANIRGGSAVHEDAEWILKHETTYCMRIIRDASAAVGVEFEWYEV